MKLRDCAGRVAFDHLFEKGSLVLSAEEIKNISGRSEDDVGRIVQIGKKLSVLVESNGDLYLSGSNAKQINGPSIDSAMNDFDKRTKEQASLLRQGRIVRASRISGDQERVEDLIAKWRETSRQCLSQLFELHKQQRQHNSTGRDVTMKKFISDLGLHWADVYSSSDAEEEDEEEEKENDCKRGKYFEYEE